MINSCLIQRLDWTVTARYTWRNQFWRVHFDFHVGGRKYRFLVYRRGREAVFNHFWFTREEGRMYLIIFGLPKGREAV